MFHFNRWVFFFFFFLGLFWARHWLCPVWEGGWGETGINCGLSSDGGCGEAVN